MGKCADDLYEAEHVVLKRRFATRFNDIDAAHGFLEHVMSTRFFQNRWPELAVNGLYLKSGNYQYGWYDPFTDTIILPTWALTDFTLLHEVAHAASGDAHRGEDHPVEFRQSHLQLVRRFIGTDAARCYRYALKAYGLEV